MRAWLIFALLCLPFLLNDFLFAATTGYEAWLFIDYATKIAVLFFALYLVQRGRIVWGDLGFTRIAAKPLIGWTLLLSVTGVLIDQNVPALLNELFPRWRFFSFPKIDDVWVERVDLSFGLWLTALSEEAVFRGAALLMLAIYFKKAATSVLFSAAVFGLIHWGLGPALVLNAAIWGILPAISVLKTRSIWPAVIAHYLTNFVDFSGLAL